MLKFRAVPRRLFSYGKPLMVEEWELTVANDEKKSVSPPTEKFSKSFQEYLDTRLTLDEMMKNHPLKEKKGPNSNDNAEPVCDP